VLQQIPPKELQLRNKIGISKKKKNWNSKFIWIIFTARRLTAAGWISSGRM